MKRHNRIPKARSLLLVVGAISNYVPSTRPRITERRSERGTPNLRYAAETNGIEWNVDIYLGHYYRVRVGNATGQVFRTIPALLGYLLRTLGVIR